MKYLGAAALAASLVLSGAGLATAAHAAPPAKTQDSGSNNVESRRAASATDMSAQRRYYRHRHYRYVRPWRAPYPYAYGYYRPRPYYYRPRPYYGPPVFSFGFGPRYW